jgi:hypothetical protein
VSVTWIQSRRIAPGSRMRAGQPTIIGTRMPPFIGVRLKNRNGVFDALPQPTGYAG